MEILDMSIDWMEDWVNSPNIKLEVDKIPELEELVFIRRGNLYFAEQDGYARLFSYQGPGEGYGGKEFKINMKDGSEKILIGPWSSGSHIGNIFFTKCLEVTATLESESHEYLHEITVTEELLRAGFKKFLPELDYVPYMHMHKYPLSVVINTPVVSKCSIHDSLEEKDLGQNYRCPECRQLVYKEHDGFLYQIGPRYMNSKSPFEKEN